MKLGLLTQSTLDSAVWHFKLISFSLMFFAIPISEFALVDDVDAREWNETLINHPMQGMKRSQHQAPIWHFVHPSWYSDFVFFASAKCDLSCALCQQRTNSFYDREDEEHFMLALPTETISTFPFRLWRSENCLLAFQFRGGRRRGGWCTFQFHLATEKLDEGESFPFHPIPSRRHVVVCFLFFVWSGWVTQHVDAEEWKFLV